MAKQLQSMHDWNISFYNEKLDSFVVKLSFFSGWISIYQASHVGKIRSNARLFGIQTHTAHLRFKACCSPNSQSTASTKDWRFVNHFCLVSPTCLLKFVSHLFYWIRSSSFNIYLDNLSGTAALFKQLFSWLWHSRLNGFLTIASATFNSFSNSVFFEQLNYPNKIKLTLSANYTNHWRWFHWSKLKINPWQQHRILQIICRFQIEFYCSQTLIVTNFCDFNFNTFYWLLALNGQDTSFLSRLTFHRLADYIQVLCLPIADQTVHLIFCWHPTVHWKLTCWSKWCNQIWICGDSLFELQLYSINGSAHFQSHLVIQFFQTILDFCQKLLPKNVFLVFRASSLVFWLFIDCKLLITEINVAGHFILLLLSSTNLIF